MHAIVEIETVNNKRKCEKNIGKTSSRTVGCSIGFIGLALLFMTLNYTVSIPYFENMRASPVFLLFAAFFFWWIKQLFLLTPTGFFPLVATQILTLIINCGLKILFSDNARVLGYSSKALFYLTEGSSGISIALIFIFTFRVWFTINGDRSV